MDIKRSDRHTKGQKIERIDKDRHSNENIQKQNQNKTQAKPE
jgi:hypothetical protein